MKGPLLHCWTHDAQPVGLERLQINLLDNGASVQFVPPETLLLAEKVTLCESNGTSHVQ